MTSIFFVGFAFELFSNIEHKKCVSFVSNSGGFVLHLQVEQTEKLVKPRQGKSELQGVVLWKFVSLFTPTRLHMCENLPVSGRCTLYFTTVPFITCCYHHT